MAATDDKNKAAAAGRSSEDAATRASATRTDATSTEARDASRQSEGSIGAGTTGTSAGDREARAKAARERHERLGYSVSTLADVRDETEQRVKAARAGKVPPLAEEYGPDLAGNEYHTGADRWGVDVPPAPVSPGAARSAQSVVEKGEEVVHPYGKPSGPKANPE